MDNLTHSLVGAAFGRAGLERKVPGGTLALVAIANLPDLDVVSGAWGDLYYLHYHRGITHSILGTLGLAVCSAVILWGIGRLRGHGARLLEVLGAVLAVAATHPLLDLTNSYGVRPFLPFLGRWYYGDLVFIVDPYLWVLLGTGVFLVKTRGRWGRALWLGGLTATSAVVLFGGLRLGRWEVIVIWLGAVAVSILMKHRRAVWRRAALASLLGVLVYWGALAGLHAWTLERVYPEIQARFPGIARSAIAATPTPVTPFRWDIYFMDSRNVYYSQASPIGGLDSEVRRFARNEENPLVQAALATCPGATFAEFARFRFADIARSGHHPVVVMSDARFSMLRGTRSFGSLEIQPGAANQIPCPAR